MIKIFERNNLQLNLRNSDSQKEPDGLAKSLLFLATLFFWMIPEIVSAAIFCMEGHSLSNWTIFGLHMFGIVVGVFILILSVTVFFHRRRYMISKINIMTVLAFLPSLLVYLVILMIPDYLYSFLPAFFGDNNIASLVVTILLTVMLILAEGFVFIIFLVGWLIQVSSKPVRYLFRHFFMSIGVAFLVGCSNQTSDILSLTVSLLPLENSVSLHFIVCLFTALLQTELLWFALLILARSLKINIVEKVSNLETENSSEEKLSKGMKRKGMIVGAIMAVLCAGLGGVYIFTTISLDPVKEITKELDTHLAQCGVDINAIKLDSAVNDLEKAEMTIALWREIAGLDIEDAQKDLLDKNKNNPQYIYLSALKANNPQDMEVWLRIYGPDVQMELALLDLYAQQETLSSDQKNNYQAALSYCVQEGEYTVTSIRPQNIEKYAEELEIKLRNYEKIGEVHRLLSMLSQTKQAGQVERDMIPEVLALAEDYPDDWIAQYIAAALGSSITYDNADHYEKTATAVMRYETLYRKQNNPSGEEFYQLEMAVAQMLIDVYDYENAVYYLEQILDVDADGSVYVLMANCYEQMDNLQDCYDMSMQYLEIHSDVPYAFYYGALSALKLGKTEEMLKMTSKLAEYVEKYEGNDIIALDTSLYSLLQYIAVGDSTDYKYHIYTSLTENQLEEIAENNFFDSYLKAVYHCFAGDGNREQALKAVKSILSRNPELPNAWYLKGAILYDLGKYEQAVEAYQKSLGIERENPTVWYALANAYNQLESYEQAREACEKTLSMIPEQDHGDDWYGVSYHCQALLRTVEEKLD